MDCFGTYCTHVQTCDNVHVQSATEWTVSVHTAHMSKPVITFVFKVLRDGMLRYILHTCPHSFLQKLAAVFWCREKSSFQDLDKGGFSSTQFMQGRDEIWNVCVFPRKMLISILCLTIIDPPNHHGHLRAANLVVGCTPGPMWAPGKWGNPVIAR